jgi:hypothetical protein
LWFHEKEPLYFAALKKDVWLKKNLKYEKKIGMPVKWLEAEEIDKKFKSTFAWR